jgi:hypothetical protein
MTTSCRRRGSAPTGAGARSIEDAFAATGEEVAALTTSAGYLTIARFSGDGDRLLDEYRRNLKVMSQVGRDHDLIVHAGAKTDDGFLIVNLWPSKERSEAAARDPRRLAVLEQAQISPGQLLREHHEVAHFELLRAARKATTRDGAK